MYRFLGLGVGIMSNCEFIILTIQVIGVVTPMSEERTLMVDAMACSLGTREFSLKYEDAQILLFIRIED